MTIPFVSEIVYHHHILIILNAAIISKKPRSRHCSLIENSETEKRKMRHMSMQDRIEMYNNRDLEDQQTGEPVAVGQDTERVRKTSRVMFPPQVVHIDGVANVVEAATEAEVHQVPQTPNKSATRARKVSKVSMFDFVQEEN